MLRINTCLIVNPKLRKSVYRDSKFCLKNNNPIFVKNLSEMILKRYFIYGFLSVALFSCTPRQEINYMKDIESIALDNSVKNSRSTLQPGDQLIITVTAKELDVVKPFNQIYASSVTLTHYSRSQI